MRPNMKVCARASNEDDVLPAEECDEVIQIMTMFSALQYSCADLKHKTGIEGWSVKFHGFDGNNEGAQLGYARYVVKGGRFANLDKGDDFNSHMPTLSSYRRMLAVHKRVNNRMLNLAKEQMLEIIAAWKQSD